LFIWSVWFIWLNEANQMNQINPPQSRSAILRWFLSVPVAQNMTDQERITHPWFARLKPAVPAFVWLATAGTVLIDLYFPLGFAPWLSYFSWCHGVSPEGRISRHGALVGVALEWRGLVVEGGRPYCGRL
jgi:hypothetical protein